MIKRLLDRVSEAIAAPEATVASSGNREAALRMAAAVLMIDVARADHVFDESEFDRVLQLVQTHFALPAEQAAELVVAANDRAEDLVSAFDFTKVLHEHLDHGEKARVVGLLWKIAYADGRLDKYE